MSGIYRQIVRSCQNVNDNYGQTQKRNPNEGHVENFEFFVVKISFFRCLFEMKILLNFIDYLY